MPAFSALEAMMLISLLALVPLATTPVVEATPVEEPAVRVWINNDRRFRTGQRVKVQIETGVSGHLMVLQLDTDGSLRVLFPVGPGDDTYVESGRRYEVRDPRSGESFLADYDGVGLIYTALAEDPYRFDALVGADGDWNRALITIPIDTEDPEADITAFVQELVSQQGFDYDLLDYLVVGRARETVVSDAPPSPSWWSPMWDVYYDDYYDCFSCNRGSGLYFNVGFGSWYWPSYWYRPWYYGYAGFHNYYPGYWGYGFGGYGGYGGYGRSYRPVTVRPRGNVPVIVGRPRGYQVGHLDGRQESRGARGRGDRIVGTRGGDRGTTAVPARRADGRNRPRVRAATGTRRGVEGRAVTRPEGRPSSRSRPATRARPRSGDRPAARATGRTTQRTTAATPPLRVERTRPRSEGREWVRVPSRATTQSSRPKAAPARRARPASSNRSVRTTSSRTSSHGSVRAGPSRRSSQSVRSSSTRVSRRIARPPARASSRAKARYSSRPSARASSRPSSRSFSRPSVRSSSRPSVRSSSRGSSVRRSSAGRSRSRPRSSSGSRARRRN